MDGTIGVIDLEQMKLVKHFKAHDDEWGGTLMDLFDYNLGVKGA